MPLELQVKLLRVLETGSSRASAASAPSRRRRARDRGHQPRPRAGGAATGKLREDCSTACNVFPIALPPLRERGDDIELLAEHFLDELNREAGAQKNFDPRRARAPAQHRWPGNVRELKNVVQRAFILADDEIGPDSARSLVAARRAAGRRNAVRDRLRFASRSGARSRRRSGG